jgi:hypothetical protein
MPLPYSQRARSIDVAYFLYSWRWAFRAVAGALMLAGVSSAWRAAGWRKLVVAFSVAGVAAVAYATNFVMSADHIFREPQSIVMRPAAQNTVEPSRLVVGVDINGEARAYPVQFIGYHHQVRDVVAALSRGLLHGVPHWTRVCARRRRRADVSARRHGSLNAMFEDRTTRSWWAKRPVKRSRDHAPESRFRRSRADR